MRPGGSRSRETNASSCSSETVKVAEKEVTLNINGSVYKASGFPVNTTLLTFIRNYANLKGTKYMCEEGGCGACIVAATIPNPQTGKSTTIAVNSCLTPVYNCHGWAIVTIEALGNSFEGYGKIQTRLAQNNGSQCGYCSPGMVMNMYCLLQERKDLTMQEIEDSFGGNICRCTGYRSILGAFKSFAKDASEDLKTCVDIEELTVICPRTKEECHTLCGDMCDRAMSPSLDKSKIQLIADDGKTWYRVNNIKEIIEIFHLIEDESYMLVAGNTAHGVYRSPKNIRHFIDVKGVRELTITTVGESTLTLGANITLTNAMEFLKEVSKSHSKFFAYAEQMAYHINLIANLPIRNVGTLAGNLSIKHQHREFPSDIFMLFEAIGAQLSVVDSIGMEYTLSVEQYLYTDMNKKVIKWISLPPLNRSTFYFTSYKITPREQNAHAYVNAGFRFKLNKRDKFRVIDTPRIVLGGINPHFITPREQNAHAYVNAGFRFKLNKRDKFRVIDTPRIVLGGINPHFVHAETTEDFLEGKCLLDSKVLTQTLQTLASELKADHVLPDASPVFREGLAVSLFYKFVLSLFPNEVSSKVRSGGERLLRPLSTASQSFQTDKSLWPLNEPVNKLEAFALCSGEAQYINDIPSFPGELHAAVVVAKRAAAESFVLKPEKALEMNGVVAFFTAKDIPGKNECMSSTMDPMFTGEEVLASGKILHAGQPLGVIVAKTRPIALEAAERVVVEYHSHVQPVIDFVAVVKAQDTSRITFIRKIERKRKDHDVKRKVSGNFQIGWQYHYAMETQTCLCVPLEDGMDVYPSTQWPAMIQWTIAEFLNVQQNTININVKRIGGAYGSKVTRNNQTSALCALSAHLLQRPVRLSLNLETNMQMTGKRLPCFIEYETGVNENGKIQYLEAKLYEDIGARDNERAVVYGTLDFLPYPYDIDTWTASIYSVRTDTPPNTWCRAPGATEASASVEHIMEHIASVVRKDPLAVRIQNFRSESQPLLPMIDEIKTSCNYQKSAAEVEEFNKKNRWKKQGISIIPLCYALGYFGRFHCNISIYAGDGTVSISHGGVECGQGINTKVAQVCAHFLGIPLDLIKVKPTLSLISPNNSTSGGSITSESVSFHSKRRGAARCHSSWKDPLAVRIQNFRSESQPLLPMIDEIKTSCNYQKSAAEVEEFNKKNRWKKQGISIIPLCYALGYFGRFHCNISIYAGDGTVSISHGGVECGQGINTKVAQVCAHFLGIPLDLIKVKPTLSLISPNNSTSGGSITSESVSFAVTKCCEEINSRLRPFKEKMPTANWKIIVQAANEADVDLNCSHMFKVDDDVSNYLIYGVTFMKVELDMLTGQHMILRTDVIQDAGQSLSPYIDIGQIEGAFIMGLGYFLWEKLIFDKETGKLLTDRTWNYKTPGAKDIPANLNITLKRNSKNPHGVLRSKATGEPPLLMSFAAVCAMRRAIESARVDSGKQEDWFDIKMPLTCENIWLHGATRIDDMTL
ncbi:indole-3-acetaldehyde oxidase [Nilaparvata lugens]|uniref:indole-3-acetaldehyde oxidase n=1 Tax=Nilaparvata lugens TaxID=108931 RepID=UPI00193C86E8|nr:indole-3-acetaldehyde oxidase [Nilaparvata lugens]